MYFMYWFIFFKPLSMWFQKKIKKIGNNSEIRPYCTIIGLDNIFIEKIVMIMIGEIMMTSPSNKAIINIQDYVLLWQYVAI